MRSDFIRRAGKVLYCFSVFPEQRSHRPAVVLCNGFASESEVFRAHLATFGRRLATAGFPALRFDYAGYGDSVGEFGDATPSSMREDIHIAADYIKAQAGCNRVVLLGVRLGATLALQVAEARDDIDAVVLWQPLPRPWEALFRQLRSTVSRQAVLFRMIRATRDEIIQNVKSQRPTLVDGYDFNVIDDGYPLTRQIVVEAEEIDLTRSAPSVRAPVLVLRTSSQASDHHALNAMEQSLRSAGVACTTQVVSMSHPAWAHGPIYRTSSPELYEPTLAWLGAG